MGDGLMVIARNRTAAAAPLVAVFTAILVAGAVPLGTPAAAIEITDTSIGETVEDRLYRDQAVSAYQIDATAEDGIVTLSGTASNILAKERAAKIAGTVKGVRAVVNTIVVRPATARTAIEVENDIVSALEADPATDTWEIVPKVRDGGVVALSGTVESWAERELAATVTKGVKGVTEVENNIVVDRTETRSDQDMQADVTQMLRWDALVDDAQIGVTVEDGVVRLAGTVGSAAEWRRVTMHAWTAGVKDVDAGQLVVAKWTRDPALREHKYEIKSEDEVVDALRRALKLDPRIDAGKVDTTIVAGMIVLRGAVDNVRAKRAATEDARHTVGVHDVLNRLRVRPEGQERTDANLATGVREAMARDPYIERFEIAVTVINGVAYLEGVVDSYFEKARADTVTAGVSGIVEVENNVEVRRFDKPYAYDPYRDDIYVYDFDWYAYQPRSTLLSDAKIKRDVERQLWWSPFVDSDDITVTVKGGVATLEGAVDSWAEFSAARENAFEGGATWVVNDLSVTGSDKDS